MELIKACARAAFVVAIIIVVTLSLTPRNQLPPVNVSDDFQHFFAYAGLALLAAVGYQRMPRRFAMAIGLIVLGILLEAGQTFVPGRVPGADDVIANSIGTVVGMAVGWAFTRIWPWAIKKARLSRGLAS